MKPYRTTMNESKRDGTNDTEIKVTGTGIKEA
jgi:hypothetical protein